MKDKQNGLFQQQRHQSPPPHSAYTTTNEPAPRKIKKGFWFVIGVGVLSILGFLLFLEIFAPVDLKPTTYIYAFFINKANLVTTETAKPIADAEALKAKLVAQEQARIEKQKTYIITKFTQEFELYKNCIDQRRTAADQARMQCMSSYESNFSDCDLITYALESKPCPPKPVLSASDLELVGTPDAKGTFQ